MQLNINDTILYGSYGICKIEDITKKTFNNTTVEYYVLKPAYDESSTIFIPTTNEALVKKMRRILSAEEVHALIKEIPSRPDIWIDDESERKQRFREIISNANRTELSSLIKTLYIHQQQQKSVGKKLRSGDERFFKEAEKLLNEEFAFVLNMDIEKVSPFILEQIDIQLLS